MDTEASAFCRSLVTVFEVTSEMTDRAFPLAGSVICGTNFVTSSFIPVGEYPKREKWEGMNRIKRESINGFVLQWSQDWTEETVLTPQVPFD
jgi:hypothetical protein